MRTQTHQDKGQGRGSVSIEDNSETDPQHQEHVKEMTLRGQGARGRPRGKWCLSWAHCLWYRPELP